MMMSMLVMGQVTEGGGVGLIRVKATERDEWGNEQIIRVVQNFTNLPLQVNLRLVHSLPL